MQALAAIGPKNVVLGAFALSVEDRVFLTLMWTEKIRLLKLGLISTFKHTNDANIMPSNKPNDLCHLPWSDEWIGFELFPICRQTPPATMTLAFASVVGAVHFVVRDCAKPHDVPFLHRRRVFYSSVNSTQFCFDQIVTPEAVQLHPFHY